MCLYATSLARPREKSRKVYKTIRLKPNGTISSVVFSYAWKAGINKPDNAFNRPVYLNSSIHDGVFHVYTNKEVAEKKARQNGHAVITLTARKEHFVASDKRRHTACYTQLTVTKHELNAAKVRAENSQLKQVIKNACYDINHFLDAALGTLRDFKNKHRKVPYSKKAKILKLEGSLKKLYAQTKI